ncbi:MAG: hypothetical protein LWX56_06015 [Ignavibacteria bacterium]|nr:hypothetical protein [Ignavibacteria bacterium]
MKYILLIICVAVSANSLFGQELKKVSPFVGIQTGILIKNDANFSAKYNSNVLFANSITLGIPFSQRVGLFIKGSYMKTSGKALSYVYDDNTKTFVAHPTESATYEQTIVSPFINVNLLLYKDFAFGVNIGLNYQSVNENYSRDFRGYSSSVGSSYGAMIEKSFPETHFAITLEYQYHSVIKEIEEWGVAMSGSAISLGGRYYFGDRY